MGNLVSLELFLDLEIKIRAEDIKMDITDKYEEELFDLCPMEVPIIRVIKKVSFSDVVVTHEVPSVDECRFNFEYEVNLHRITKLRMECPALLDLAQKMIDEEESGVESAENIELIEY